MADLYGTNNARSSSSTSSFESEDMSTFLHDLFDNPSVKTKNAHLFNSHQHPLPPPPLAVAFPDSDHRFSDLGCFISSDANQMSFPPRNNVAALEFGCQVQKSSEGQQNQTPRRSSKRTRAAEIHNLSEKRRRSRINEKLKALQTLVPNSNKTDKASMLDEAIEYLKQLQLRVQTLAMRNGLGLQPMYPQEQTMLKGISYDEGYKLEHPSDSSAFSQTQEFSIQREFDISNHSGLPPLTSVMKPDPALFGPELPTENQYGFINQLTTMKDVYRVNRASKAAGDSGFGGKNPLPGVSL